MASTSLARICFLCNLFLEHHGRFYTGRTHGVLYPNWAMPSVSRTQFSSHQLVQFQNIISAFQFDIQQALGSSIVSPRRRSQPNESDALLSSCWTECDSSSCDQLTSSATTYEKKEQKSRSGRPIRNGEAQPVLNNVRTFDKTILRGGSRIRSLTDRFLMEFSSISSYRNSTDLSRSSSVSFLSYHTNSKGFSIPVHLRYGVPYPVRCPANLNIMILVPRLSLSYFAQEQPKGVVTAMIKE